MGTAILLGIPEPYVARLRHALETHGGIPGVWTVKYIPAPKRLSEITNASLKQARKIADEHDTPHIFGFSIQQNRSDWASQLVPYFRFRWCDQLVSKLNHLATPDPGPFLTQFAADLAEEEQWTLRVKPADMGSPLLLPECSFDAGTPHRDLWRHARSYGDPNTVEGAEKAIREFERIYLRKSVHYQWVDRRDLVYGRNGPRHADAPFPRGWKYSYRLPPGFHFDVTQTEKRKFYLFDAEGLRHSAVSGGYINIDPHGYVRGN